ncbi:hypothetical protein [Bradyrhizobium arachidis]|uniref:Uncharacterized protein n=1 Tax=Bradyrhizobium arachidis TaxID=858423 RepID=A0AAE7NW07_9BRAD|nr:hypothetical protein [Bradyrhizobium arachidis]QOZ70503.1 hypothetical protein WN72_32500 [Bradyrhizobium arachidis]SFU61872.1 hypothetical protein SAMN05192541_103178 [Bradyrhizobium arachidis]
MKNWWRKWSYEIPLAIGDALWEILVVQFAALLDRLTWRKVAALAPVAVLLLAYYHSVPLPPALMLIGDLVAYIDIFSVVLMLSILSRAATIAFLVKRAAIRAAALLARLRTGMRRIDPRQRRGAGSAPRPRRKPNQSEDDRAFGGMWGQAAMA